MRTIAFILTGLLWTTLAWGFQVGLTAPSHPALGEMVYATVVGKADALDANLFHLSIELAPELQSSLSGANRFGLTGFWFNSQGVLPEDSVSLLSAGLPWSLEHINNSSCAGGCSANGAGFGEFDHKVIWVGHPADLPDRLDLLIRMDKPVIEEDFLQSSVARPASFNLGMFSVFIDGFDLLISGERIRGTFIKD